MTSVRAAHTDDRPSRADSDVLVRRYDEVYAAWCRQIAIGAAMRAGRDGGPGDEADHASTSAQLDEQDALTSVLRTRLDDLAIALERCGDGSYGRCEECGCVIPADRLELFPAAYHCVSCKQRRERR
jgi:RNA polymerase-binding transcription factor DksA